MIAVNTNSAADATICGDIAALLEEHRQPDALPTLSVSFTTAASAPCSIAAPQVEIDRPIRIGCMSKLLTSMCALALVDDGKLVLDDPAADMVAHPPLARLLRARGISVRHLLSQTTGLDDEAVLARARSCSSTALLDQLASAAMLYEAGTVTSNERLGYITAGHIIEQLTGKPYLEAVSERVLAPLSSALYLCDLGQLRQISEVSEQNGFDTCGSDRLMMTAKGLLALATCIMGHSPSADAVLSTHSRQEILRPQALAMSDSFISGYGLGLNLYHNGLVGMTGGLCGEISHLGFTTSGEAALAFQAIGTAAAAWSLGGVFSDLLKRVAGAFPYCEEDSVLTALDDPGRLVGTYERSRSVLSISAKGRGHRHLRIEGQFGYGSYLYSGGTEAMETLEADLVPMSSGRFSVQTLSSSSTAGSLRFSELTIMENESAHAEFVVAGGVAFRRRSS